MNLLTTFISLIVIYLLPKYLSKYEFFTNLQKSCNFSWVEDLLCKCQRLANKFHRIPTTVITLILILLTIILILILQEICYLVLSGIGLLIFNIILLFYCFSSINHKEYSSIYVAAFEHIFGMLFWFTMLGPVSLGLFWLFTIGCYSDKLDVLQLDNNLSKHNTLPNDMPENHSDQAEPANLEAGKVANIINPNFNVITKNGYERNLKHCLIILHTIAAWVPARITGLIFSLIGDFKHGFNCWAEIMKNLHMSHTEFLDRCGEAALGNSTEDRPELLIERTFIAWLIICVIISLKLYDY